MTPAEFVRGDTSIREATRADLLDVLRIEKAVFAQPWPYSAFERHVDRPAFLVSECETDESPLVDGRDSTGGRDSSDSFGSTGGGSTDSPDSSDGPDSPDSSDGPDSTAGALATTDADALGGLTATDDSIAGYVVADEVDHATALGHVKNLAVHPDCRNEGVGSALLDRSLSVLGSRGIHSVKLEVRRGNDAALGLYRSFGFERVRTIPGYYADGEDALLLVADLES